jgi:hypothetical protein
MGPGGAIVQAFDAFSLEARHPLARRFDAFSLNRVWFESGSSRGLGLSGSVAM